ncbi:MAG: mechanosensitive ion channel family protein [Sedimentisphaerales bacterium]|nr:mechanosensitive ion channel family protein [Sedimentisphaerales bacterium]
MTELKILLARLAWIILPVVVFLLTLAIGYAIRRIVFARLIHWSKKTSTQIDDIIIASLKTPMVIWFVMLGLYLALQTLQLPAEITTPRAEHVVERIVSISKTVLMVLGYLSVTFALASMAGRIVQAYSGKIETALPVTSLTRNVTRIVILVIGILIIIRQLGIDITPLLTTLGIGGLAVALALQDTLANLFAGFHIIVSKQIKVGDFVRLESGEEGYVTDINWRTTKIRMLPNNVVLIPNDKLAKALVINYYQPDKEMAVLVQVGVHYDSDLRKVEQVTIEVAREVMKEIPGGVPTFEPFIRYHTFGDFSINFSVIMRAREVVDQHLIKHEFIKRLHERYRKEGIIIPYPIRAINYSQEKAMLPSTGRPV